MALTPLEYETDKKAYFDKLYSKFISGEINMTSANNFYFIIFENESIKQIEVESFFLGFDGFNIQSINTFLNTASKENGKTAIFYDEFGFLTVQLTAGEISLFRDKLISNETKAIIIPSTPLFSIPKIQKLQSSSGHSLSIKSNYTGKGIKIAILDSGFDCNHPDFKPVISKNNSFNFIEGNFKIQDNFGHGTHCTGIACGDKDPNGVKFGVAKDSIPYIGKILDDQGNGDEVYLASGLFWCLKKNCDIISLSLGGRKENDLHNPALERLFYKLYSNNILTFAAAGNNSYRKRNSYWHISTPANCPHAISVGGIDSNNTIYNRSNRAIGFQFMSFVGPAVNIYSTWSTSVKPKRTYKRLSGTSMSTPYIAGIAALILEEKNSVNLKNPLYSLMQRNLNMQTGWLKKDVGDGQPNP